jgi:hypothetical protein
MSIRLLYYVVLVFGSIHFMRNYQEHQGHWYCAQLSDGFHDLVIHAGTDVQWEGGRMFRLHGTRGITHCYSLPYSARCWCVDLKLVPR